jgi:hypothetical protein
MSLAFIILGAVLVVVADVDACDGGSRREETVGVADGAVERVLADAEVPGEVVRPLDQRGTRHGVHAARRGPLPPGVCLHGPEAGADVVVVAVVVEGSQGGGTVVVVGRSCGRRLDVGIGGRKRREDSDGAEVVVQLLHVHGLVAAAAAGEWIEAGGQRLTEKLVSEGIHDLHLRES